MLHANESGDTNQLVVVEDPGRGLLMSRRFCCREAGVANEPGVGGRGCHGDKLVRLLPGLDVRNFIFSQLFQILY